VTPFVLVTVGVVLLSGCGEDRESERLPRAPQSSTSATEDDSEGAEKQAAYRVNQYVSGTDTIRRDPGTYRDPASIGFADTKLATRIIAESLELEDKGRKQVGEAEVVQDPVVREMDLNPKKIRGKQAAPYVSLRVCIDASETYLVDTSGKKVKGSEGQGARPMQFHVINRSWPSSDTWRIAWTQPIKGAC